MDPRRALRFLPLALVVPLAACATMGGLREEPLTAGVSRTFPAPLGPVVDAARQAMVGAGMDVQEQLRPSPDIGMLLGQKGMSLWSYGELVRVVARQTDSARTSVYVVTRRLLATNITAREDWSTALFDRMEVTLGLSGTSTSEGPVPLLAGTRVRLAWREQGRTLEGEFRALRGDTLVVYDPVLARQVVAPVGQLRSLEVLRSRRTASTSGSRVGALIGAVAGAAVGAASYQPGGFVDYGQGASIFGGAAVGAGAGLLVGLAVGSTMVTERWDPVPLSSVHVGVAPLRAGRLGLGASIGF